MKKKMIGGLCVLSLVMRLVVYAFHSNHNHAMDISCLFSS